MFQSVKNGSLAIPATAILLKADMNEAVRGCAFPAVAWQRLGPHRGLECNYPRATDLDHLWFRAGNQALHQDTSGAEFQEAAEDCHSALQELEV